MPLRPEPWPLDEPRPPAHLPPPAWAVWLIVAAIVGVVGLAAAEALDSPGGPPSTRPLATVAP
jgi:hypothetical protein